MHKLPPGDPQGIRMLQVGCGPENIFSDWWNVDVRHFPGIDEVMDVTKKWPWENCLRYVYGEHFIEHLSIDNAAEFLKQANSALILGGKIRLTTPSLEWVLSTHFKVGQHDANDVIAQTLQINRAFYGWGHRFLYSKKMLESIVVGSGFGNVSFFEYGNSSDEILKNLERHGGYFISNGFPSVWIVEAQKIDTPKKDIIRALDIHASFLSHVHSGH